MTERNFCRDCKWNHQKQDLIHYGLSEESGEYDRCMCPKNVNVNLVTGATVPVRRVAYCETLRAMLGNQYCGPDGRWFEARESAP